jgi:hypothetical protein
MCPVQLDPDVLTLVASDDTKEERKLEYQKNDESNRINNSEKSDYPCEKHDVFRR